VSRQSGFIQHREKEHFAMRAISSPGGAERHRRLWPDLSPDHDPLERLGHIIASRKTNKTDSFVEQLNAAFFSKRTEARGSVQYLSFSAYRLNMSFFVTLLPIFNGGIASPAWLI
jgi:hypothetical protein